jgi:hypothetical protein
MDFDNLPIKFPSRAAVIAQQVADFRALTPIQRIHELDEMFRLYHFLLNTSGRSELLRQFADQEEERGRTQIMKFVASHE